MVPLSPAEIGIGLAYLQLALGLAFLVYGLRGNAFHGDPQTGRLATRFFAPAGLFFILQAMVRFINGHVPDAALIAGGVIGLVASGAWALQIRRALKARLRELTPPTAP